jgi:hypothetical protein
MKARISGGKKQIRIIGLEEVYGPDVIGTVASIGAEFWQSETKNALTNGFDVLRGSEDDTALISRRGLPELLEAEESLGRTLPTRSMIAMCIYDENKIPKGKLLGVLRALSCTHGHAMFQGLATRT